MNPQPSFCGPSCADYGKWNCALPWYSETALQTTRTAAALLLDATLRTASLFGGHPVGADVFGLIEKSRQHRDEMYVPAEACVILHSSKNTSLG